MGAAPATDVPSGVAERTCSFSQVDGYRLAGRCHEPAQGPAGIGIVFAHGFCGTQDVVAPAFARALVGRGGCAVLTFDYSGFGASEGPRGRLDPVRQVHDCQAAVAWLAADRSLAGRVGIVGLSLGAAVAVVAADLDPTVPFVAGLNGVADGARWMRDLRSPWELAELRRAMRADGVERLTSGRSRAVGPDWVVPRGPEAQAFHADLQRDHPTRQRVLDVASAQLIWEFRPLPALGAWPSGRALFVHADEDCMAPVAHSEALAAATGGELLVLEGVGHYEVYEPGPFARVIDAIHAHATTDRVTGPDGRSVRYGAPPADGRAVAERCR
jgi:pimeloyl-ACP methyl ester carboxylesterase